MTKPTRAVAILNKGKKVLLIHRLKEGKEYYVFPGGGVEKGETIKEAALRELREETTIRAKVKKLLYAHDYTTSEQYFYLCEYLDGQPKLSDNCVERKKMEKAICDSYEPTWVAISKLKNLLLYPLEIRDWLIKDFKNGFRQKPRKAKLKVEELRQSLSEKV